MKKCKHVYKARIHNHQVCSSLEHREAGFCRDVTHVIKICTACGEVDIDTYDAKLTHTDFYGTPITKMILRYQAHLSEIDDITDETEEAEEG